MANDDFIRNFQKLKESSAEWQATNLFDEQLREQIFGNINGRHSRLFDEARKVIREQEAKKPFANINDMMAKLGQVKNKIPTQIPIDKAARRKEIEHELDIIRGRIPTPKGYTIKPLRVKQLMTELKQLNEK